MRSTLFVAAVALAGLLGCVVDVNFGDGTFLCMEAPRTCPASFECRSGRCVAAGTPFDAGATEDAASDGQGLVPAFAAGVVNSQLNDPLANNDDASFTGDRLVVVFNSNRGGVADLWTSSRASVVSPWQLPVREDTLSSPSVETTVALSSDGLTILFGSARPGGLGALDIYRSTRASRIAPWSMPINVASLNSPATDKVTYISDDGSVVGLSSNRGVEGVDDLYLARFDAGLGDYLPPEPVVELNSPSNDNFLRLAADGLVATFHSNRPGGAGQTDIYSATRESVDTPFSSPIPIVGINTAAAEQDPWLAEDLCYLAYVVNDEMGNGLIYESACLP